MIRAMTLFNIGANCAAALSDCDCFAEAESRKPSGEFVNFDQNAYLQRML